MKTSSAKLVMTGAAMALALAANADARIGVDEELLPSTTTDGGSGFQKDEGGFVLGDSEGDYKLLVGGRLQGRFDYVSWDDAYDRDNSSTFSLRRARLFFLGHIMGDANRYFVQLGADSPDPYWALYRDAEADLGTSDFTLMDAWVKHTYSDTFAVKIGQFKTPFGRQNLTSSGKLQFPERALAIEVASWDFNRRDIGLELSGGFNEGIIQYAAVVSNGEGPNTGNSDNKYSFMGRLSVNPTGDYGYAEGAGGGMATTIGVAGHLAKRHEGGVDEDWQRFNIDGGLKSGRLSLQAELLVSNLEAAGTDSTTTSFYLQGGYFLSPEKVELAGRVSRVMPEGDDNELSEYSLGLNFLHWGHRLKLQAAWSLFDFQETDTQNHRVHGQAQFWF